MKGLYFLLGSTFFIGLVSGVFIYFISNLNEPLIVLEDFGIKTTAAFEITGDSYGGCQRSGRCASYKIDATGNYTSVVRNRGGEDDREEGKLSASDLREIKQLLRDTPLATIADSSFMGTCPVEYDGLAYVFDIKVGDDTWRIDTCAHNTEGEELFEKLESYFSEFAGGGL